jgi:hypothetical protein
MKPTEAVGSTAAATGATLLPAIGMAIDEPADMILGYRVGGRSVAATDEVSTIVRIARERSHGSVSFFDGTRCSGMIVLGFG